MQPQQGNAVGPVFVIAIGILIGYLLVSRGLQWFKNFWAAGNTAQSVQSANSSQGVGVGMNGYGGQSLAVNAAGTIIPVASIATSATSVPSGIFSTAIGTPESLSPQIWADPNALG